MQRFCVFAAAVCLLAGCAEKKPEPKSGIHIQAPGVDIQVGGDGETKIIAPGTDVRVSPGKPSEPGAGY